MHGEWAFANPARLDFIPPGYTETDVTHHNVITEWRANDPTANRFAGTRRELMRVAHVTANMQMAAKMRATVFAVVKSDRAVVFRQGGGNLL